MAPASGLQRPVSQVVEGRPQLSHSASKITHKGTAHISFHPIPTFPLENGTVLIILWSLCICRRTKNNDPTIVPKQNLVISCLLNPEIFIDNFIVQGRGLPKNKPSFTKQKRWNETMILDYGDNRTLYK